LTVPASGTDRAREATASEEELLASVGAQPLPRHVAIIMDGNGRWAGARGLPRIAGHREGVKAARAAVRAAARLGIEYLTLYAFSSENWARPAAEVDFLMYLLQSSVDAELPELSRNNVRIGVLGETATLSAGVRQSIERAMAATAGNSGLRLLIALNYGGRRELVRTIRALAERVRRGELVPDAIEETDVAAGLDTAGVPDPDLLIRTSGEHRLSNFLLWQVAYTEFLVLPVLWPDFSSRDFYLAVADYQQRSRRFGGI
jgi:undecaprenyl diphosphate synthase